MPGPVWVAGNWVDQTNPGASTPIAGDVLTAPAGETAPNLGGQTLVYGENAFSSIKAGVDAAAGGGTVYVLPGTYTESDISLDAAVSVIGPAAGSGVATLVPAVADSHAVDRDDWFGGGTHNAFVIRASNVALSNLTIDGGADDNYFCGVETDWTTGSTYNDLSVTGVTVENVFCLGIDVEGGAKAGVGDVISGNTVENVQGATIVRGICLLDASGQISGNQVSNIVADADTPYSNAAVGIYIDTFDIPGVTASIDSNTVSGTAIGINVMALDNPSDITGNTITLPSPVLGGGGVYGIVVRDMESVGWASEPVYSGAGMTVANNQIDASGSSGTGIYLYDNPDPNNPVLIENNSVTASAASAATGIDVSDDGSPFGDSTLAGDYATLTGNTTSNLATGIEVASLNGQAVAVTATSNANTSGTVLGSSVGVPPAFGNVSPVLTLGNSSGLGSGYLTVNAGELNVNSYGLSVTALRRSGGVITDNSGAGGATTVVVDQACDTTFSGVIADGDNGTRVALSKTGNGGLTLLGEDAYTGGNTVGGGTLVGDTASIRGNVSLASAAANVTFDQAADGTYSGVVSGSGSFGKTGVGTLIVTAQNTYSGGTTVSAGSLQLGDGSANNGSIAGNVLDNANVTFANPLAELFNGAIGGSGDLTKLGSGVLTMSAPQSYAGATRILAGTLNLSEGDSGFGGNGAGWTTNGGAAVAGDVLTLTDNAGNEARSAFCDVPVLTGPFTASFVYQAGGDRAADGAAFVLQNDSGGASASGGAAAGWATAGTTRSRTVRPSSWTSSTAVLRAARTPPAARPGTIRPRRPWPWAAATRSK